MPTNDPEYQKAYRDRHYAENRERYLANAAARKQALKDEINALKEATPCADCRLSYPHYVMDFDHRPGEIKVGLVSKMVNNTQRTKAYEEIKKCDIVCANCHRERTYQRAGVV